MGKFELPEKSIVTPFGKNREKHFEAAEMETFARGTEKGNEINRYDALKRELAEMKDQKGGVDFHFSQFNPYGLSRESLDRYDDYKKGKLTEEELKKFAQKQEVGSYDYQFAALLEHWIMGKKAKEAIDEKEKLKKEAARILQKQELSEDVAKYLEDVFGKNVLRKCDYEAFILQSK